MNLLQKPLSLLEINHLLEEKLRSESKTFRVIGDLDITYEEYCFLSLKTKGIWNTTNSLDILEKYKIVAIVSWVFSLRYSELDKIQINKAIGDFTKLQQHIMRKVIDVISGTFEELGINTFDQEIYTLDGLLSLIGIHAGVPDESYDKLFNFIDDSTNYKEVNVLEQQLNHALQPRMNCIRQYMDKQVARKQFFEIRDIFIDCKHNNMSLEELLAKYSDISSLIIENCVQWCSDNTIYQEIENMQVITK